METIQKIATLRWVHLTFLIMLRLGLGSGHRVLSESDQGIYHEPDRFGLQLGGTWSFPSIGIGPIGGFLGFGSDSGAPQFRFGGGGSSEGGIDGHQGFGLGGGGGFEGGNNGHPGFGFGFGGGIDGRGRWRGGGAGGVVADGEASGCSCDCCKTGGGSETKGDGNAYGGSRGSSTQPSFGSGPNFGNGSGSGGNNGGKNNGIVKSLTCRPMNCQTNGDCEGYGRHFDGSPPYWCDVPGFGVLPFLCPGALDKFGQSSSCIPLGCPSGAACPYGYPGPGPSPNSLFRINGLSSQQKEASKPQKVDDNYAAGHN